MFVLGISDVEHDTAAALLDGKGPVAAIEEEKLSRSLTTAGIPRLAIDHCLQEAHIQASDLSLAAVASRPNRAWLRDKRFELQMFASHPTARYWTDVRGDIPDRLRQRQLLRHVLGRRTRLANFEHHLCHAASAFYPSEFDRALVLTLDQSGDLWSGLLAIGEGTDLRILRPIRFPNSLGWFYTGVTELLGFRPGRDEHKVQWLSKEGTPEFLPTFRRLFSRDSDGLPVINLHSLTNGFAGHCAFSAALRRELRISELSALGGDALRASIARSAQDFLEETVIDLAQTYRRRTSAKYLSVAGGVFLNVLLVHALEERAGFEQVFVQPVSGNPGTALGAAYLGRKYLSKATGREPLSHLYLGPNFEEDKIKAILDNCKTIYRCLPDEKQLLEAVVRLLQHDKIVAWYQGRLEFGHRALGNRSILASAFSPYVMENLNEYIKHRESFHPFAVSVPAENAAELFTCTENCRFMSSVGTLKEAARSLKRFAFNGGAVRVHKVERPVNPRFWKLLRKVGEEAPLPVLLNTSFNLFGEPLVCDPREAIRSFYCSGIDALVMETFLVVKP